MGFSLENVVPWGRSFDEYVEMFRLNEQDLSGKILGCGDGPASFNATLSRQGGDVVSVDPIYHFTATEIQYRINESYEIVLNQVRQHADTFVWDSIPSPEALGRIRMEAMDAFLADFSLGVSGGRYIAGALPNLPFKDRQFDLALCSHFLFLYSEQYSVDFHLASIQELFRVATEVRIFPLLELNGSVSRHLAPVMCELKKHGYTVAEEVVIYEFQKNGNKMLRIRNGAETS